MQYNRNNLDEAASPYLRQHKDNPIWWQEWRPEVLDYAEETNRILFVSVGYSACHWCHVMASEAFSDKKIAEFLNQHFVSIKVDREQRPDIDRFLMSVAISATGASGWPLNVFLTSSLKPITGLTYLPVEPRLGMPGFFEIIRKVKEAFETKSGKLRPFSMPVYQAEKMEENEIVARLFSHFDFENGGFGAGPKFPPHSHLLFMLYYFEVNKNKELKKMLEKILDVMLMGGLQDHLQGGFFRYCVDKNWTIPHFEKMLYDQAFLLWAYSLAYKLFGKDSYRICAQRIVQCLGETFEEDGLFYSAHDADADHEEGACYLWGYKELKDNLGAPEYEKFREVYDISEEGNFEGKNHLIKKKDIFLEEIEAKLLKIRKRRKQPFVDKKIITALNCHAGVGLILAFRYLGSREFLKKAEAIFEKLINHHYKEAKIFHSFVNGLLQQDEFMEDYAAMLLLITYLHEEKGGYANYLKDIYDKLLTFKMANGQWIESNNPDFLTVPAEQLDYSIPSSTSLANLALARADALLGRESKFASFSDPMNAAFLNIGALISNGYFYIIQNPEKIGWERLPINVIQVKANALSVCYKGACKKELPGDR